MHATDKSLLQYLVTFQYCLHLIGQLYISISYFCFLWCCVIISYCFILFFCNVLARLVQLSRPVSLFALIMTYITYVRTYLGLLCDLNILSWCSLCMWSLHFTLPEASEWPQSGEPSAAHHPLVTEGSGKD